jgi:hypothetical protein
MRRAWSRLWNGLRTWNETGRAFSPAQMRVLALLSALSTSLVIWAGFGHGDSNSLAAAIAQRRLLVGSAAASQPAATSPGTDEESSSGGAAEGESELGASASEAAQATTTSSGARASESAASEATTPTPTTAPSKTTRKSATPAGSKIKHVFVITLASPGYEQTWGPSSAAHYLTTQLRPRGTLLSEYYAVGHLDLPNYIAMISGQPPNQQTSADCPTFASYPAAAEPDSAGLLLTAGCVYPTSVLTVGDQLTSSRRQWRAYVEDLAAGAKPVQSCRHPLTDQPDETQHERPGDGFAARHNPFVYFHSLLDLGDCAADDLPLTQLPTDLSAKAKTANYSFIVPDLCHDGSEAPCVDGSPGGLQAADAFLAEWVPKILASAAYRKDGLLVITFSDGPASDTTGCCQGTSTPAAPISGGGRVGALLVSRFVAAGREDKTPYNHYSLLRTVEDIFGLKHLGDAEQSGVSSFSGKVLKGVFAK